MLINEVIVRAKNLNQEYTEVLYRYRDRMSKAKISSSFFIFLLFLYTPLIFGNNG